MPLGFKNGTCGSILKAVNAIKTAGQVHTFFGVGPDGFAAAVRTRGNPDCHLVLRGGATGPNYDATHVAEAEAALREAGLPRAILVDCSHDNSGRRPQRQPEIVRNVIEQVRAGNRSLIGVMLESNLYGGSQPLIAKREKLQYGVSITDACLDWESTERCLRETYAALAHRFTKPKTRVKSPGKSTSIVTAV
jgi:3-deoxy-7-phosphoheptulonate synthase